MAEYALYLVLRTRQPLTLELARASLGGTWTLGDERGQTELECEIDVVAVARMDSDGRTNE